MTLISLFLPGTRLFYRALFSNYALAEIEMPSSDLTSERNTLKVHEAHQSCANAHQIGVMNFALGRTDGAKCVTYTSHRLLLVFNVWKQNSYGRVYCKFLQTCTAQEKKSMCLALREATARCATGKIFLSA